MYVCLFLAVLSIKTTSKQPLVFHNILFVSIPELFFFFFKETEAQCRGNAKLK